MSGQGSVAQAMGEGLAMQRIAGEGKGGEGVEARKVRAGEWVCAWWEMLRAARAGDARGECGESDGAGIGWAKAVEGRGRTRGGQGEAKGGPREKKVRAREVCFV